MLGYLSYRSDAPPYVVIGGARFRAVRVAAGRSLRAALVARAAARRLRREGVRVAVFPPEYPYREAFARRGVSAPPLAPLYRATAAAIARCALARRGLDARRTTVALAAASATPELCRCAIALCADARYLLLAVPHGGEALARRLRRERGVAARLVPFGEALRAADLLLAFDGAPPDAADVLRLDETLRVVYDSAYANEMLAALWRAGALDPAALRAAEVG